MEEFKVIGAGLAEHAAGVWLTHKDGVLLVGYASLLGCGVPFPDISALVGRKVFVDGCAVKRIEPGFPGERKAG